MRLLLDQGLPRSAASLLRQAGHDAEHVGELGMESASDAAIVAYAAQHGCVVLTLDADFHSLLALSGAVAPSVIRFRMEGLRADRLTSLMLGVLSAFGEQLAAGCAMTVTPNGVRIRSLPIRP